MLRVDPASLCFPAGVAPGFDPTHIAAQNCVLSAVAMGGNFVDLLTGKPGTPSGSLAAQMHGVIGPAVNFTSGNVAISGKRSYGANAAPLGDTMALIYVQNSSAVQNAWFSFGTSGTDTTYSFISTVGGNTRPQIGHQGLTTISLPAGFALGTPCFFAASQSLSAVTSATQTANILLMNLATGQVLTATGTNSGYSVGSRNGTYNIGSRGGGNLPAISSIAAVMASDVFMSLPQLSMFAADMQSFWYPTR